ncbi:MAG: hypothetical protein JJU29_09715 [Verrucomicrobia bacterium]|nr:hypothetical protein [Verrucomicrobiota bacterium]MCH8511531.1 hypothetical protein [Kiritimatiellia bacterium]
MKTLGEALQETRILSPVRRKLMRHGFPTEAHWVQLATLRGCHHYQEQGPHVIDPGPDCISNLEIAAALLSNESKYNPTFIRVAAQLISGESTPDAILRIADMERLQTPLRHIAEAGKTIEPDNVFWTTLLINLPPRRPPAGILPHRDRFTTEAPIHAGQLRMARSKLWLRPHGVESTDIGFMTKLGMTT